MPEVPLTPHLRAIKLADGILEHPLSDDQAIELAKVYASLSVAEATRALADSVAPILDSMAAERITAATRQITELAATSDVPEHLTESILNAVITGGHPEKFILFEPSEADIEKEEADHAE